MPTDAQYQRLLAFRTTLRRFDQWSRGVAEEHGITHAQHQLLLAIRGSATGNPRVGEVAESLLLKPHSATELIDRAQELDLVQRTRDAADARLVRVVLTDHGNEILKALTASHIEELKRLGPLLSPLD